jgi:hypothetical protein
VTTILLDANVYDKLQSDSESCVTLRALADRHLVTVIAAPVIIEELRRSPLGGIPDWFPIAIRAESVAVLGYWMLGMAELGEGAVYGEHRGKSRKIPDAIIADSANALADIFVSEDRRCRARLKKISARCTCLDCEGLRDWLRASAAA